MAQPTPREIDGGTPPSGGTALLLRLTWMLFGNGLLVILGVRIVREATWSPIDVIYWAVAATVVVARYLDISRFGGQTADGAPATIADWRRWTVVFVVVAITYYAIAIALRRGFTI